jgi:hypothetical protein
MLYKTVLSAGAYAAVARACLSCFFHTSDTSTGLQQSHGSSMGRAWRKKRCFNRVEGGRGQISSWHVGRLIVAGPT